jgi:hypothetical protein
MRHLKRNVSLGLSFQESRIRDCVKRDGLFRDCVKRDGVFHDYVEFDCMVVIC